MPTALDVAYRAAHYRVFAQMPFTLRVGEPSAELDALLDSHAATTWAFATACNPGSQPLSAEENAERMSQLHAVLTDCARYPGEGGDPAGEWPGEPSVLVVGISREEAVRVAVAFGQNAILTGVRGGAAELVWV
jgi:hypothetical protein